LQELSDLTVYFVDSQNRNVLVEIGGNDYVLNATGSEGVLSMQQIFADVIDINLNHARDLYSAGDESIRDRPCKLFLFSSPGGRIQKRIWVGIDDGLVYREQYGLARYEFQDTKINTALTPQFLGATPRTNNLRVVSQDEVNQLLRENQEKR
jgi:hypothetical protein